MYDFLTILGFVLVISVGITLVTDMVIKGSLLIQNFMYNIEHINGFKFHSKIDKFLTSVVLTLVAPFIFDNEKQTIILFNYVIQTTNFDNFIMRPSQRMEFESKRVVRSISENSEGENDK